MPTPLLASYVGFALPIYKCPADKVLSDPQKQAGWTARVRSVSMNAMVGDPGTLLNGGVNVNNPTYRQFLKDTDIPKPSEIFVFLDEHPDSINDGYFIDKAPTTGGYNGVPDLEWTDLPASYHNGGASFVRRRPRRHPHLAQQRHQSTSRSLQRLPPPLGEPNPSRRPLLGAQTHEHRLLLIARGHFAAFPVLRPRADTQDFEFENNEAHLRSSSNLRGTLSSFPSRILHPTSFPLSSC